MISAVPRGVRALGWIAADARGIIATFVERLRPAQSCHGPVWGSRLDRTRDYELIGLDHQLRIAARAESAIDDRTWTDLHMDAVFNDVDRCVSTIGQQYLYHRLRVPADDALLRRLDQAASRVDAAPALRDRVQDSLARLGTRDAYFLPNLFRGFLPPRPRFYWVFPFLTGLALGMFALLFFRPTAGLIGLLLVCGINLTIQYRYHARIQAIVRPLTLVRMLLRAAESIGAESDDAIADELACLRQSVERLRPLARASRYTALDRRTDDLVGGIYAYANMLLLLDVNAFAFSLEAVERHRDDLRTVFEALGFLDAAVALASYRAGLPYWCRPEFQPRARRMELIALIHPLVPNAVANDLAIHDRNVLITGSNMSGKTTFIRAVAVNALLASTVFTCTARTYRAPRLRVRTIIGRGDDLAHGKSYYAVELELSLALLGAAKTDHQHLFVIDEMFRGTNTTERIAASKAVLTAMVGNDHIVLAATHDLELLPLLQKEWEFQHFREAIDEQGLHFDYTIHAGPASTHNALRLMQLYGFPAEVVADATATVIRVERGFSDTR